MTLTEPCAAGLLYMTGDLPQVVVYFSLTVKRTSTACGIPDSAFLPLGTPSRCLSASAVTHEKSASSLSQGWDAVISLW